MNLGDALAWLDAHVNLEMHGAPPDRRVANPTLERMSALVQLLGSPQLEFDAIHLTGTNGKTSVARMVGDLLVASGLSVGSYTSPHLEHVNERLAWNGEPISDAHLAEQLSHLALVEDHVAERSSYFELLTGAALHWFADVAVHVAVVEVGLGGRWDATNVVAGAVAVVTNVSVDHTEFLGPTVAEIAGEKSGIVKPGATLVLGETDPELVSVFEAAGAAQVLHRGRDFGVGENRLAHGGRLVDLFTSRGSHDDLFLSLHGAHQADNAAIALAAAEAFLNAPLEDDLVAGVFSRVTSPGRLEVVGHQPLVLLDGAHNVAGAHALTAALAEAFPDGPRTFVVGLLREKDPAEMLAALDVSSAARVVCCAPPSPRAIDPAQVAKVAGELGADEVAVAPEVADALDLALDATPEDGQVVVTGSLYTVGAARAHLMRA
jgi:dihydrofolate synthase/folylpolyglutamate synthase